MNSKDFTVESETSLLIVGSGKLGFAFDGNGVEVLTKDEKGGGATTSDGSTEETSREVGFSLVETGDADALLLMSSMLLMDLDLSSILVPDKPVAHTRMR